jgi:hypothetical protein
LTQPEVAKRCRLSANQPSTAAFRIKSLLDRARKLGVLGAEQD